MPDLFEKHRDDMTRSVAWKSTRLYSIAHYHAGIEIAYVVDGSVSAVIGGKKVTAHGGQAFVSGAYTVHSYTDEPAPAIVAILPPGEVPAIQKQLLSGSFQSPLITDEDGTLHTLLKLMIENQQDNVIRKGLSYSILGYTMKKAGFSATESAQRGGIMAQVLGYLSENYAQPLSVEALATHFGYSRSRFSHLFKANIGVSIPRYINILRCRDAVNALIETDLPVVDIAINAGFNNTHTFYVAFRELYGMTPGEYVKKQSVPKDAPK